MGVLMQPLYEGVRGAEKNCTTRKGVAKFGQIDRLRCLNKDEDIGRGDNILTSERDALTFQRAYQENKVLAGEDRFISMCAIKLRNS